MNFFLEKIFKVFLLVFCTIFIFGCIKKSEKVEKENILFQETLIDDALDFGIFIFPNSSNIRVFKEEDFLVCMYEVFLDIEKKIENKSEIINDFVKSFAKIYINEGWVLQEPIFTDKNINISAYKEDKSIFIVFFPEFLKKLEKYKITVHSAINIFS